jgi:hypothetical protein
MSLTANIGASVKNFTFFLVIVFLSNSVYAGGADYKCRIDDKTGSLTKLVEFYLPFNSQKIIELLDNQHFAIVNFYGDFLEVSIEDKTTQKVVFRSMSKGPHFSIQTTAPSKLSLKCQQ